MPASADRTAVTPEQSASLAFRHLIDELTEAFDTNLQSLMMADETEPVHKARVALRRIRTALAAFDGILDEDLAEAMQDRSRALFRILGAIRDADVLAARFSETDRAEEMAEDTGRQRHKARKLLRKKRADEFRLWALKRLSGKRWRRTGKKAKALRDAPVAVLAAAALGRAWTLSLSNGGDIQAMSARAQHELRKDLKMLRYLSEFFADLWPGATQDRFLATLRELQDDLGELTDTHLARSLGHDEAADVAGPQARAARSWASLIEAGPWWPAPPAAAG